jgi:phospholipid/cholesterol/gamma-HCH transport system substrate-binding protein
LSSDAQGERAAASSPADAEDGARLARFAALAGLIAAVALVAIVMFGNSGAYTVKARFTNAGQLVKGNQVEVGGRPVGKVTDIALTDSGDAEITMQVDDEDVAPLHRGTSATVRATSLSGIANRYVSLQPGRADAPKIPDGGSIPSDRASAPVDLDQLFNTFDPKTRRALQQVIRGSGTWYGGRARQASQSAKYLSPALSTTSRLTQEVALDDKTFERFVVDAASVVSAVAQRRDDLAGLVGNANTTAGAIADENVSLDRALQLLPSTLRRGNTTFVNLRSTLDDLDVLVKEAKPATRNLAPFLRRLRPLVHDARPTIRDLRVLIRRPGRNNDLIELTAKMPRLASLTHVVFPRTIRALNRAQPVIETARTYTPDLAGWFEKFGHGASNYDANGHYARIQPLFSAFSYTDIAGTEFLTPNTPANRLDGLEFRQLKRCPGGSIQPAPDGSAPFVVPGCDPSTTPP